MIRLTREVRFGIDATGEAPATYATTSATTSPSRDAADTSADGGNGFAGRPALTGVGHFLCLRLTLEGEVAADSGYLRNIKDVDDAVRRHAVPWLQGVVAGAARSDQRLARQLKSRIEAADGLPGATIVASELLLSPFLSLGWYASEPDMIRLSQKFEFSAAHRLHNPALSPEENVATFGKCNNPHGHGHNYELQVTVAGVPDVKTGQLIAVDQLERIVDEHVIDFFDHKHLNHEVREFADLNPSVENIAMVIYRRLAPAVRDAAFPRAGDLTLASVTVWETPKTWAEFSG